MKTILWRPNTVSIIETKLWRPNFGDLKLWRLYYRNIIIETIDYEDLMQRPHIIYICIYTLSGDPIQRYCI